MKIAFMDPFYDDPSRRLHSRERVVKIHDVYPLAPGMLGVEFHTSEGIERRMVPLMFFRGAMQEPGDTHLFTKCADAISACKNSQKEK